VSGLDGNAIVFDGTAATGIELGALSGVSNPITICAWIKPVGWGGNSTGRILDDYNYNISGMGFYPNSTGQLGVVNYGSSVFYSDSAVVALGAWQHVAVRCSGESVAFYVDGVARGTSTGPIALSTYAAMIGNRHSDYARGFAGSIQDVRIYSRALSAGEIQSIANKAG
jgi:hypothetical protein